MVINFLPESGKEPIDIPFRSAIQTLSIDLSYADLEGADLSNFMLIGINFEHANLKHANFENSDISYANFFKADLSEANFKGVRAHETCFEEAMFHRTSFQEAELVSIHLDSDAFPEDTNLEKATVTIFHDCSNLALTTLPSGVNPDYSVGGKENE